MKNSLHRLQKLCEDFVREQNFVDDLKAIAGESPSTQLLQLIDEAEMKLANLQGELATLTGEVTKAVRLTLTKPQMIEVMIRREVEGEPFASIARRLKRSVWRTRDLHKQGVKLLTAAR